MERFITSENQVTTEWLAEVLKDRLARENNAVVSVKTSPRTLNTANAFHLQACYARPSFLPEDLFLKIGRRYSEVSFFQHLAPYTRSVPLVPCYHALFANEQGLSNLLFKDIGISYTTHESVLPPSQALLEQFVSLMACLHKSWWEHPDLQKSPLKDVCDDLPGFVLQQVIPQYGRFVDVMGDALSSRRRQTYERILAALPLPQQQKRLRAHQAVTVVHGDTHFANFALPSATDDPIYLQDWALWHVNLPAYDLAYMLGRCYPEFRAHIEMPLLMHYHQCLDIPTYSWEMLWDDYRMSMIVQTIWPIFFHTFAPVDRWYQLFECSLTAFETLGCADFL